MDLSQPLLPCPFKCGYAGAQTTVALGDHILKCPRLPPATPPPVAPVTKDGKVPRVALYARVSTDQGEQDPDQQLDFLRREAQRRGYAVTWEGADLTTGNSELWDRPWGGKLWHEVKAGRVDVVMTYDAARLSREHPAAVFDLLQRLEKRGVRYVSATERFFDTSDDNDFRDLVVGIIAWANNFFLKQLKKSTIRGKAASKARGIPQGRHGNRCGIDYPCPTGAHDENGRSTRLPKNRSSRWLVPPEPAAPLAPEPAATGTSRGGVGA